MTKIFIILPHNNPSGGTKVANQVVNLLREKKFASFIVTPEPAQQANFLREPAPAVSLNDFSLRVGADDIVITFWQQREILEAMKNCPAKKKIFWQHGIIIPRYADFNGEEYFRPGVFTDYWNVSAACADYIKEQYRLPEIKIVHPFFDDETLKDFLRTPNDQREGILLLRRRGQEVIPDIISSFPEQKITILPKKFSDAELYQALAKHKYFVSTDNGVNGALLIKNNLHRAFKRVRRFWKNIFAPRAAGQIGWVKPKKNLLGFPVTACEAAWLGTTVIAFAMGGGREWMNDENIFLARDGDVNSLLSKAKEAIDASEEVLQRKKDLASAAVQKFSRENTWQQLKKYLEL
ncbi:MAG TPA: hypothetical protein VMD74_04225 [Candidatus Methylomirabilis sp.]|nr:hypothetical protein [Candidatus Methylomirabilis sp.]